MLTEFLDVDGKSVHDQFQAWRTSNQNGTFLTLISWTRANLHGARCQHLGSGPPYFSLSDGFSSLTNKRKVCGPEIELREWAARNNVSVKHCDHCVRDGLIGNRQSSNSLSATTYLLTWNPDIWDGEITSPMGWSCGNTKRIVPGDRLFVMRQGREPRGVCGSGWAVSHAQEDTSGEYRSSRFVQIQFEIFRDPVTEPILNRDLLEDLNRGVERPMDWSVRKSGTAISSTVAKRLEEAWRRLCESEQIYPDELPAGGPLIEGSSRMVLVNAYERNSKARRQCVAAHGAMCSVCKCDFGAVYGAEFSGFIHVHHRRPISEARGEYVVDPIKDLVPVCPNCHAVIHYAGRLRDIEEVRRLLAASK